MSSRHGDCVVMVERLNFELVDITVRVGNLVYAMHSV